MSDNSSGKLVEKYLGRNVGQSDEPDVSSDAESGEDGGTAFGWLRGIKDRAISLELRKRTGLIMAIGYNFIEKVEFDASVGITIQFGRQQIIIKGRNLNTEVRPSIRVFEGIARHRVSWVAEANRATELQADQSAVVIESISW